MTTNQRRRSIQPSSSGTFAVPQIPKSRSVSVTGSGSIAPTYVQVPSLLGRNSVPSLQQAQETQQVQETREVQRASAPPLVSAAGSVRPPTASSSGNGNGRATSLNVTVPISLNVPSPSPLSMDVDTPVSMDISPALTPVLSEYDALRIGGGSGSGTGSGTVDTQMDSRIVGGQNVSLFLFILLSFVERLFY